MKIISDTNKLQISIFVQHFYTISRQNNEEIM